MLYIGKRDDVSVSNEMLAEKLDLLSEGNVTRAGILVFHHNPEKWVTGAWIKIGFFADDATILYQDEIHGSLLQQADKIMDLLYTKYLTAPISFKGIIRIEKYPYPKDAVREALLNAIVHKNYGSFTPIQIRVYKDKLRIANDSILPDGISPEQLINEGKSRPLNPKIANAFFRAGYIESWGRGIQEIRDMCKNYGNPNPDFQVDADAVFVTFYSLEAIGSDDLNVPQDVPQGTSLEIKILKAIRNDDKISRETMAKLMGVSKKTVGRQLAKMRDKVQFVGSGYSGHWEIIE